jgi:hypothetical protein
VGAGSSSGEFTQNAHLFLFCHYIIAYIRRSVTIFIDCYFYFLTHKMCVCVSVSVDVSSCTNASNNIEEGKSGEKIGMKAINQKQFSFTLNGISCAEDISCHRSLFTVIDKYFLVLSAVVAFAVNGSK